MKKLTQRKKQHLLKLAKYRLGNIHKKKKALAIKKKEFKRLKEMYKLKEIVTLVVPEHFNIVSRNLRSELLQFISRLRTYTLKKSTLVYLDFKKTTMMGAEATLYFLAELETILNANKCLKFKIIFSKNDIVNQVLYQTGILRLLKVNITVDSSLFDESVKCWAYASGENAQVTSEARGIVKDLGQLFTESVQYTRGWFKVITEAMTNCHHHAYLEPRFIDSPNSPSLKKWWLFSKEVDGVLTVCICDLGVGIPRSLKSYSPETNPSWLKRVQNYVKELRKIYNEDSALIKAAIEIGKTRTNLPNRGKGLSQIINELGKLPNADVSVSILSNTGGFKTKKLQLTDSILIPFNDSIHGTIITWQVSTLPSGFD